MADWRQKKLETENEQKRKAVFKQNYSYLHEMPSGPPARSNLQEDFIRHFLKSYEWRVSETNVEKKRERELYYSNRYLYINLLTVVLKYIRNKKMSRFLYNKSSYARWFSFALFCYISVIRTS